MKEFETETVVDSFKQNAQQVDKEYTEYRKGLLALSIKERAQRLIIPELVWQAHTGNKVIPKDIADKIIERQEQYFTENPRHSIASPTCYRDIVEPHGERFITPWQRALLRVVEAALIADKKASNTITIKI